MGKAWRICVPVLSCMLAGCFDDSYGGGDVGDNTGFDPPVPVLVEIASPEQSKGSGPVDDMSLEGGKSIYVYAFNADMLSSYAVKASDDRVNTLLDGSVDRPDTKAGRRAVTYPRGGTLKWADASRVMFYHDGDMKHIPYEFYAYYMDDVDVSEDDYVRTDDAVRINVEIDGRQDLMTSKAELTDAQLETFDSEEQERLVEYSYSYYSGLRNVLPRFSFRHHLARLEFEVSPGYVAGIVKNITVQSVEVESKYRAVFTVAERSSPSQLGLSFPEGDGEELYRNFVLREADGSPVPDGKYSFSTLSDPYEVPRKIPMGGSLLVAPQKDSLIAYVTVKETREDGAVLASARNRIALKYTQGSGFGSFDAGNMYRIKLQVFGITTVNTSVTMEPWRSGGNIMVDTEDDRPEI